MDLGDAADFAAKIMVQSLFDLQPHVDLIPLVKRGAQMHKKWYEGILLQWLARRNVLHQEAAFFDYVGDYSGYNTTINMFLRGETAHLAFTLNSHPDSMCDLELFNRDQYSFLPTTRGGGLTRGMFDWDDWFVSVLKFKRGGNGKVEGFPWEYEPNHVAWFSKI